MKSTLWFIFCGKTVLLRRGPQGRPQVPHGEAPPLPTQGRAHPLGFYHGVAALACELSSELAGEFEGQAVGAIGPLEQEGWLVVDLRVAYDLLNKELYRLAGKGFQLLYWDRQTQFCPVCGSPTLPGTEISKSCPGCGQALFPVITPAILALVRKEDKILLAHAYTFNGPFFSILAGFLEVGETLEECVFREVLEESGLKVQNITYFGSQTWPFPSGLMVGFIADYQSGELALQQDELSTGGFYGRDNLPPLPDKFSLARQMIDWWITHG